MNYDGSDLVPLVILVCEVIPKKSECDYRGNENLEPIPEEEFIKFFS